MKIHAIKTLIFIIQWATFIQDFISSEPESGMGYTLEELKILFDSLIMSLFLAAIDAIGPWQHNRLQALCIQRVKSEFPSFRNYLFLSFTQWV